MPIDLLGLTSDQVIAAARRLLPSGAGVAGRLYARSLATGRLEPEAFGLSPASSRAWRDAFTVGSLTVRRTAEEPGEHGITVKAVLATADGHEIECVRIPVAVPDGGSPRSTLCLSSQVGCRQGCEFCETGCGGLVRNLAAAEIVAQVVMARSVLGWDCRNVVFMGMGEPLDNFDEVAAVLRVLTDQRGLRYPAERLTVCTAGDADGIRRLRALGLRRLNLSISLNAADDTLRARLMPITRRTGLAELAAALSAYPHRRTFVLGVNYCLLPGINDTREDAHRVATWCAKVGRVYVNLIPYNPGTRPVCRAPTPAETDRFLAWLREDGLEAGLRSARGGSIMAGCGQLGDRAAADLAILPPPLPASLRAGIIVPQGEHDMKKGIRSGLVITGSVLAVLLAAAVALIVVVRRPFPKTRGTLHAAGLTAPVEIVRDPAGVPHITAANMHDLYVAQGFVHAQDRFWQMEFWRRIGSGRLSELFGESTLGTDLYLRTVGFRRIAEEEYAAASAETRAVLDAYAEGVNAYIGGRRPGRLGLEFVFLKLQGVKFDVEPWTPVNSLTWLKIMSQDLGGNMNRELYALDLLHAMGSGLSADFFGVYQEGMPYIVADDELPASLLAERPGTAAAARSSLDPADLAGVSTRLVGGFDLSAGLALGTGAGIGSNNWVIAGSRTASGRPILANDPHLGIQMPSIWYEIDLACTATEAQPGKNPGEPFHVRGFSFPGTPCVIVGHNDRIAWGVTNVGPDVQDLYIERINPANPDQYEVNGRWVDMTVRREEIRVEGRDDPVELLVRGTRHGPIVTDQGGYAGYRGFAVNPRGAYPANIELKALALRWTALQRNATMDAVIAIDRARSFDEFRQALRSWDIPSQNFVYADVDGNIGYQTPGLIPVRTRGDGSLPVPGWTDEFAWKGFIPFDELPWSYNPAKGYVVTANNPVASPNYRHFIAGEFDFGYRARRIAAMIEGAEGKLTVADVQAMQADTLDTFALELVPYLAPLVFEDPAVSAARDLLAGWDGRMEPESAGAALYAYFWVALIEKVLDDQVPRALWDPDTGLENNSRQMNTIAQLLPRPDNGLWDRRTTPGTRETRDDIFAAALVEAVKRGTEAQGKNLARWRWGREHTATFRNQSLGKSGIGLVERIFNRGPVPVGGGFQQVSCTDYKVNKPFGVHAVSSLRQVVDLADLNASRAIHTTGQSGHAFNPHYADFIDEWAEGRSHPTLWDGAALKAAGGRRLVLKP